ncbi:MAG: type I-F CRISPR-associated protein Csy2 [Gammaproteobacteria bacterium HGW-Gammaproteobacteria-2]|jgi:CRISPR-associated protein Csy2|nr:MAG: type I-F CRISPR-associated protein Csy2 [Gammaproteobacteria bacterium HGW-Gammaproteobacteria-2]
MNSKPLQSPGVLVLPHLRIQNANAISSPLTHGFPSMTAFLGLMWALERKLEGRDLGISFDAVGVICHDFDEQTTDEGYVRKFRLTRNPIERDGGTAAIVEEGRIHLDITVIFAIDGGVIGAVNERQQEVADAVAEVVAGMRVAGGSVLPSGGPRWRSQPRITCWADDYKAQHTQFRQLRRRWLPGFALVARDDLLATRTAALQASNPDATALDALLDLSRFNWRSQRSEDPDAAADTAKAKVEWHHDRNEGWLVPIPVGYGALSELHPPGSVANTRDGDTSFRFVDSLYSIGQWLGPHRLNHIDQLLWYADNDPTSGLYRCRNDYATAALD